MARITDHTKAVNAASGKKRDDGREPVSGPASAEENGAMEYLDLCDENGVPVGTVMSREQAHRDGLLHRTAHVWIVRRENGGVQVLLQKRSMNKDSFPGRYDTSSAGHVPAGCEPLESALRELEEELGISASPSQLRHAGRFRIRYEETFHGKLFRDNEVTEVFVYDEPVDLSALTLQESEVEEVRWFDLREVIRETASGSAFFCAPAQGLEVLDGFLAAEKTARGGDGPCASSDP